MTLESKPSTLGPPKPDQVIDIDDETETIETLMGDYYKAKIDHNHPNFHMIWKIVKEERKILRASIDLFKNPSSHIHQSTIYPSQR